MSMGVQLPRNCELCGGDGWVTIIETVHKREYTAFTPCRCTKGQANHEVHRRINVENEAELHRLFPGRKDKRQAPSIKPSMPRV